MIVRKVVRGLADRTAIIRHWQTMSNFRALGCKYRVWLSCPCALAAFDASCYGLCPRTLQLKLYLEHAHGCKPRPNPRRTSSVLRANLQRTSGVPRANLQRTSSELRAYLERTSSVPVPNLRCDNLSGTVLMLHCSLAYMFLCMFAALLKHVALSVSLLFLTSLTKHQSTRYLQAITSCHNLSCVCVRSANLPSKTICTHTHTHITHRDCLSHS